MMDNLDLFRFIRELESPCYVYRPDLVRQNYKALKAALPGNFKILYSLKANPNARIVGELRSCGSSFDVASLSELQTVLSAGVDRAEISFVGPGKTEEEIRFAIHERVGLIVVESFDQLEVVQRCAREIGRVQDITFRINPKEFVDPRGRMRANRSLQFGIDEEDIALAFDVLKGIASVRFKGIHTHVQSQILEAEYIVKNFERSLAIFTEIKKKYAPDATVINFGGGFGIPYGSEDRRLDLGALKRGLEIFSDLQAPIRPYVETGRFLVGEAGYFVTKVLYRKESRGKKILIVDGGMNNNFSVVGAHQFDRVNYKVTPLTDRETSTTHSYTVVGPSCYSMDVLASDLELPEMHPGDYLCFHSSGSYGRSFSPTLFLGQKVAREYILPAPSVNCQDVAGIGIAGSLQ